MKSPVMSYLANRMQFRPAPFGSATREVPRRPPRDCTVWLERDIGVNR